MFDWQPIEYAATAPDGTVITVQWDGLVGKWRVCDSSFSDMHDSLAQALTSAEARYHATR
jgi:hypothetical protein